MEKKKNTMRLTESKLLDFIEEGVKQTLKEYRGETYNDGDYHYIRPNGDNNIGTGLNFSTFGKEGKRSLTNMTFQDGDKLATAPVNTRTPGHHGKGDICYRLANTVKDTFYGNDKIEWTDLEKEKIEEILGKIRALASLTKKEGNKKRGYDGPEKAEDLNESFGHATEAEESEAMRQWEEENLGDDLDWEVYDRIDHYDTCLAGTVTSDEGWKFTAYGSGDEHGDFIGFDDNAPEIEFKMPDGREGYFIPENNKVTMTESQLINHIYGKVKKRLGAA